LYSTNRDGFSPDHERIIEIITRQVAPMLRHASEFQSAKAASLRDQLTGLPNFEQFLKFSRAAEESSGVSAPASLLLIDVNNLKQINADLGRSAGDAALNYVVEATRRVLRQSDMLFRDEDDQFIAVLLHTSEATSNSLATKLREAIRALADRMSFSLNVETAIAITPRDGRSFEILLRAARQQLHGTNVNHDNLSPRDRIH